MDIEEWFLDADERGNPGSDLGAWRAGNEVRPLVDGAAYFDRLVDEVRALGPGTTCGSPTGVATTTSGSAPTARRSVSCSSTRPGAGSSSGA